MTKRKRWKDLSNKELTIRIALLTLAVSFIAGIVYVVLAYYLNSLPEPEKGVIPVGGAIDGQAAYLDSVEGYIKFDAINRREALESHSKEMRSIGIGEFDQCFLELVATNKGENEVYLTNFTCKVTNLQQINEPLLFAAGERERTHRIIHLYEGNPSEMDEPIVMRDYGPYGADLTMYVENHGWASAKDVTIEIQDEDNLLEDLLYSTPYKVDFKNINSGETVSCPIFDEELFNTIKIPQNGIKIRPYGLLSYKRLEDRWVEDKVNIWGFLLQPDGSVCPESRYGGGISFEEVAILIDADNGNEWTFKKDVNEFIPPHEVIELPIRFTATRSCKFDIEIDFTVNHSTTVLFGKSTGTELFVSSINGPPLLNGELMDEYSLSEQDKVYFPYAPSQETVSS